MKHALFSFTPTLSKKLIAKGVAALPEVQRAFSQGKILIGAGSTTVQIFLELGGEILDSALACGMVTAKGLCVGHGMVDFVGAHGNARYWLLDHGQLISSEDLDQALKDMNSNDVFIKGANAIDSTGQAGVLLGIENGGTIGKAVGHVMAKGMNFIIPVGLEKSIMGSVQANAGELGIQKLEYSTGMPVGLIPVSGKVITEIQALRILANLEVFHVASGGISGGEGSVTLLVKGESQEIEKISSTYAELRRDNRLDQLSMRPASCAKHKWRACIKKNICYKDNVKNGI